ncbi:retinal rod rhodopsin-sensitive cGMP 3',5'-cyclic phosphodiesterase subunit gamma isoform X3 [Crotalus tigris]|uniref:retinal rod rhodopsin-sensitive cGMP 3',5'-cyclic phosphodiesterase subunit gamma isoform X3 n=1 Tax=Crotalus tigris TaxID=88082 RepID=UPI00192F2670|nr:retinal rod rhodopsin-sensitive cGMP 3',5'-cyclic phosphodiesterase subunit gamma isoform X3 [Crotalus tigris]
MLHSGVFCCRRGLAGTLAMSHEIPKPEFKSATRVTGGPVTPRKGPPKFKQRQTRQFKSKPPKKGVQGFGDDIPGMEGLGTDITVICPWEAFSHLELHELAQYGII